MDGANQYDSDVFILFYEYNTKNRTLFVDSLCTSIFYKNVFILYYKEVSKFRALNNKKNN